MLIDVNTLVKKPIEYKTLYKKRNKIILGVRSYSSRCSPCSGFDVLAKKSRLALKFHSEWLNITESIP